MPTSPSLGFLVSQEGSKLLHGPFHDRLSSSTRAKPKQPEQFIKSPHVVVFMNERNCLGSWANTDISSHFSRFVDSCFGNRTGTTQCPFLKKASTAVELSPEGRRHGPLLCSAQVLLCYTITSQAGECDSWPAPVQGHCCRHGRCHGLLGSWEVFWVLYLMIFPGELAIFTGLNAERERHQSTKDAWMCPIWHKALKTKKNGPSRCHPSWRHHENQSLPRLCLLPNRLIHDTRQPLERVLLSSQETHMEQQAHLQTCRVWERSSLTFSNSNNWPTVQPESWDLVLD